MNSRPTREKIDDLLYDLRHSFQISLVDGPFWARWGYHSGSIKNQCKGRDITLGWDDYDEPADKKSDPNE